MLCSYDHCSRKAQQGQKIRSALLNNNSSICLILYKGEAKYWKNKGMTYNDEETRIFDSKMGLNTYTLYFTNKFDPLTVM